jgi:Family of unknown function (DUF5317)
MRLMLLVITLAVITGKLAGGRLDRLPHAGVRCAPLALVGLALQLAPLPTPAAMALLYLSFALLLVFTAANLRRPGFPLILLGVVLNLAVIVANAGMPVSLSAIVASGQQDTLGELAEDGDGVKHHLADPSTRLLPLGDVLAVPPPVKQVISVGDIAVDAGIFWFVVGVMRAGSRRRRPFRPEPETIARG